MSHFKLSLTTGNPPKEKLIYVPQNWQAHLNTGNDPDDFLKKLIMVLDRRHIFSKGSHEGFYITTLRQMKGNEIHLKIRNLGDLESGLLRPVGLLFDRKALKLNVKIDKEEVHYDPVQYAQDKQRQAALEAEANKIAEAERRQTIQEKSKNRGYDNKREQAELARQRQLRKEQEREREHLRREQERLQEEQERRIFLRAKKEHENRN